MWQCAAANVIYDVNWLMDCGGAVLDLAGGEYLISQPITIPPGYSNFRVTGGTLRASPAFPPDRALLEIGYGMGTQNQNLDVNIDGLFLDAYQIAAGCLAVNGMSGGVVSAQPLAPAVVCVASVNVGLQELGFNGPK